MTTNYLCNEWLDDADRRMFEDMKKNRPKRYQVAGLGDWGVEEGLVFENWHVEDLSDRIPSFDKIYCGCDFGWNDPTAMIKLCLNKNRKEIYIFDEVYQQYMTDDILKQTAKDFFKKEIVMCDSADPKTIDFLASTGIKAVPVVKGADSILRGIRWLQSYEIVVHKDCNHFIDEISQYAWLKDKYDNVLEKPCDENNHLIDAMRYSLEPEILAGEVTQGIRF